MPFLSRQSDIVAARDGVRTGGRPPKDKWNRPTESNGGPDLSHDRCLGHFRRKHKRDMCRDPGRLGIVSDAHTFDPLAILVG